MSISRINRIFCCYYLQLIALNFTYFDVSIHFCKFLIFCDRFWLFLICFFFTFFIFDLQTFSPHCIIWVKCPTTFYCIFDVRRVNKSKVLICASVIAIKTFNPYIIILKLINKCRLILNKPRWFYVRFNIWPYF